MTGLTIDLPPEWLQAAFRAAESEDPGLEAGSHADANDPEGGRKRLLAQLLKELPGEQRLVLRHLSLQDRGHQEVARALGMTERRVRLLHTTALKTLWRRLDETGLGQPAPEGAEEAARLAAIDAGTGAFAGLPGSVDDFLRERQEEEQREVEQERARYGQAR